MQFPVELGRLALYLALTSKKVTVHDFEDGFVLTTGTILSPLVLYTVPVFESYLKGKRSSFAIRSNGDFLWREIGQV